MLSADAVGCACDSTTVAYWREDIRRALSSD
jgi:hypothetical protein